MSEIKAKLEKEYSIDDVERYKEFVEKNTGETIKADNLEKIKLEPLDGSRLSMSHEPGIEASFGFDIVHIVKLEKEGIITPEYGEIIAYIDPDYLHDFD